MTRFRVNIAQLMAVVLFLGLGFAALRNADQFLASVTFTLSTMYDKPDGRLGHRIEWQWTCIDDTYLPAAYKQISFLDDGTLSTQCDATLEECALNKPLRPHQFDYEGLGLVDGDEIHSFEGGDIYLITNGQLQKIKAPAR